MTITSLLRAKWSEQVDRTEHLLDQVPANKLDWRPDILGARPLGELLGHLLDCLAGFCATFYAAYPAPLAHFAALRHLPVNHRCEIAEARERIAQYRRAIEEGFALSSDADLARSIPTVFVPQGEALFTLLLGNLEHLINHKYQLFTWLKLLGIPVESRDIYQYRS